MTLSLRSFTRFLVRAIPLLALLSSSLLAQAQPNAAPAIRYVKPTATGTGSGNSWANASGNLQAMINASSSGEQVWVAAGTYKPGGNANTDRTISFAMKNGVSMYGGFAGNETALSARPVINLTTPSTTILSGDIGEVGDPEDNSFHVMLNLLGVTSITVLDGFVITGGNANETGPPQEPRNIGGGICNVGQSSFANPSSGPASSPQISNCLFVANSATSGGAIYNGAGSSGVSSPTLTNCVFRANTASNGGAVYNVGGSGSAIQPRLTNCLFQSNSADAGGAVYNYGYFGKTSNPELTNCSFQDNRATSGGAVYNNGRSDRGTSSPTLTNCSFKNNRAEFQGGAIFNDGDFDGNSSPLIRNCSFQANSAGSGGGAIFNLTGRIRGDNMSRPKLTNCLFQTNTASYGGAIYTDTVWEGGIELVLTNCTFQANTAVNYGGAIVGNGYGNGYVSNTTLINCVVSGNGGASTFYNTSTTISATYSLFDTSVTGYSGSTGNRTVTVSPFASTSDPALFACSPAVNAGLNSATGLAGVTTDLANNPRIFGERVDMGAYEYQAAGGLTITVPSVSTATAGVAFSQSFVASGGTGPYSYSLASGSLPTGLSLASNGTLSGTPTGLGSFSITVRATNATSCSGVSAAYVLRVTSATPVRYVRAGASGSGNSWADASGDLQSQINFAGAEQVWVATGTYRPTGTPAATTNDRTISFSMKNGVHIYGGFAGTETDLSQRVLGNPLATILSGDIGTAGDNADNSYHVFNNPPGLTSSAVLDGFLITGGNANGTNSPDDSGGGMINNGNGAGNSCSPLIRNCLFISNRADNAGGALYNAGFTNGNSNPSLINCAFQSNAASRGGAIYNDGSIGGNSNPSLTNCSLQANSAGSGGAMGSVSFQGNSRPVLTNCVVWGNGGASTFNNQQGAFITTSYSLFESSVTGYNAGTGNLTTTTSPFASTMTTLLSCSSPAIDAGDPATTAATVGPIDLAGNDRFFNGTGAPADRIDMGAYEVQDANTIAITTPTVNTATLGVGFNQSFTASGGTGPYSYSLASGNLPTGLGLAPTGVLSGTPTQIGSFTITVLGRSARGCSAVSAPYVLTVRAPVTPIRYVRAGGTGSGSSWADASGNLQSQIDFAGAEQVWVAQGTYKPTTTNDRTISFSMKNGVAIYGGFAGIETTLAQRNPTSLTTVLSGNIGNAGVNTDNTRNVFNHPRELNLNNTAVLDGFVIRDGFENDQNQYGYYGGGMYNDNSSPTVTNCNFLNNTSFLGGGMFNNGTSNPVLSNCNFRGNTAINTGGGIHNQGSSQPRLTNCSFVENRARFGGGMGNVTSRPSLTNCTFQGNTASEIGGGVYNSGGNSLTLTNCSFVSNTALERGGGMYNDTSSPTLTNCSFQGNTARDGGGICSAQSLPTLTNCLFQGNSAARHGGGMLNDNGTNATLINCSFLTNTASALGAGMYNFSSSPTLTNGVVFGNGGANTFYDERAGSTTVTYSLLEVGVTNYTDGGNNLTTNVSPFVSATDARLNACSPAINTGNNAVNSTTTDLAGNARVFPGGGGGTPAVIDMGAYEYQAAPTLVTITPPSVSTATLGVAFSQRFTASGGSGPYSYSLVSGSLPPGLNLSSMGVLSGTPTQAGSFTITALATDATGCSGVSVPYGLTVTEAAIPNPTLTGLTVSPGAVCVGSVATFTATVGNVTGNYSYTLTNGLGSSLSGTASGTSFSQSITASGTGPQNFTLTVIANGRSAASVTALTVTPLPVATLTNNGPLNCTQSSVTLTAGGGTSYTFATGSDMLGTPGPANTVVVSSTGTYSVTVATASGCVSTTSTSVTADQQVPSVSINPSGATLTCATPTVSLTAVGRGSVRWNTGETSPRILVSVAGTYSVTLTGDNTCTAVASVSVSQDNTAPVASLVSSGSLSCSVTSVTLTASPGGQSYVFSAGATQIGTSNQAVVSESGTYSVTVISDIGCSATASTSVISTTAAVTITNPTVSTATVGQAFNQTFTAQSGTPGSPDRASSYSLASGSLPVGLSLAPTGVLSGTPTQVGSFTITVRATDAGGCSGVSAPYGLTVTEAAIPNPTLAGFAASPEAVCVGNVLTFTARVGNVTGSYNYTLTNNTSSTSGTGTGSAFSQTLTAAGSGVQTFTLTVSSNGQSSTATTSVTVNAPPSPTLSSSGTLTCANPSVTLTASGGDIYRFSSGANQTGDGPTATVNSAGIYSVTVVSANGCSAVASTTVTGDQRVPEAGLTNNGPLSCSTISVTLTASGGNTYRFSNGTNQIGNGPTATVSTAGVYSVTVVGSNGCSSVASTTVTGDQRVPSVSIQAAPSLTIAQGQATVLTASASGSQPLTYTWSTGQATPAISVSTAGAFSVTVVGSNGCSATASVVVSLTATPVVSGPFAITGVSLVSCTPINEHRNVISINPEYDGLDGSPVSFSIVNEFRPTTEPGPYTLQLYVDNPVITLRAVQAGVVTSFAYNWLAACNRGVPPVINTPPTVVREIAPQTATAGGYFSLNLAGTFADAQTPDALVLSASGLPVGLSLSGTTLSGLLSMSGVSTITITAVDPGGLSVSTGFTLTVLPAPVGNTAPAVVGPVGSQTALVGQSFTLSVASVFTDVETPGALTLSSSGLPAGLSLAGTTISGTPSVSGTTTVTLTATDPGKLSTSTSFVLTVQAAPASGGSFAIVGVNTLSCTPIVAGRIDISFTPRYGGLNGSAVTFSVPNELGPTTAGGPYSLQLYTDNPTITLQAVQSGVVGSFAYNWLAACASVVQDNTPPRLNSPVASQTATAGQGYSLRLATVFTDTETPDNLVLSASGLPAGLSLTGTTISGTPSVSGTSTVVLTATDPGSLTAATSFVLTVSPVSSGTTTAPFAITSVTTVRCEVVSEGQRRVSFTPQYAGLSGQPIRFSVVNELSGTTNAGPYSLSLYTDNPVITLSAQQGSLTTTYAYSWLASCPSGARSAAPEVRSELQVRVLGNPVEGAEVGVEVRGAQGQPLRLSLTDPAGRPVSEQWVERAGGVETLRLSVGTQPGGMLLLRVSTPTQGQTVNVLKR